MRPKQQQHGGRHALAQLPRALVDERVNRGGSRTRIGAVRIVPTLLFFTLDRPRKHPTSRRVFIKLHVWRSDRVCKTEYISHITVLSRYH